MLTIHGMDILKKDLIRAYGGNASALARELEIKPQAVYGWPEHVPIGRVFELRVKRPDLFNADGSLRADVEKAA
jgi:hypothetical protein